MDKAKKIIEVWGKVIIVPCLVMASIFLFLGNAFYVKNTLTKTHISFNYSIAQIAFGDNQQNFNFSNSPLLIVAFVLSYVLIFVFFIPLLNYKYKFLTSSLISIFIIIILSLSNNLIIVENLGLLNKNNLNALFGSGSFKICLNYPVIFLIFANGLNSLVTFSLFAFLSFFKEKKEK